MLQGLKGRPAARGRDAPRAWLPSCRCHRPPPAAHSGSGVTQGTFILWSEHQPKTVPVQTPESQKSPLLAATASAQSSRTTLFLTAPTQSSPVPGPWPTPPQAHPHTPTQPALPNPISLGYLSPRGAASITKLAFGTGWCHLSLTCNHTGLRPGQLRTPGQAASLTFRPRTSSQPRPAAGSSSGRQSLWSPAPSHPRAACPAV